MTAAHVGHRGAGVQLVESSVERREPRADQVGPVPGKEEAPSPLQELVAAGWTNEEIGAAVRALLGRWTDLLAEVARETEQRHGSLGPFTPEEVSALLAATFIGAEAMILTGFDREVLPIRAAVRRIGTLIRALEERDDTEGHDASLTS